MTLQHLEAVQQEVAELAERFAADGFRLFLVGGIVRDLWLDAELSAESDIDLTTDARPEDTKRLVADWAEAVWTQGERFGTIGCMHRGRAFEITTHRAEVYDPDSRKPEVAFGDDIEADLARRDFTVNAMAWEVPAGELIDPFDGVGDLTRRQLRTPLAPEVSFSDDPLRMIRAARFSNRYDLTPSPELLNAASALAERLDIVAVERVRDELQKLLSAPTVDTGLSFLLDTGLLRRLFPDVTAADVERASRLSAPWWLRVVGLSWAGPDDTDSLPASLRELRFSGETISAARAAARAASAVVASDGAEISDEMIRRWVHEASDHPTEALQLAAVVCGDHAEKWRARWQELAAVEDLSGWKLPLDGGAVAAHLDLPEGPRIGAALTVLRDHWLAHGPFDEAQARHVLDQWWSTDGA